MFIQSMIVLRRTRRGPPRSRGPRLRTRQENQKNKKPEDIIHNERTSCMASQKKHPETVSEIDITFGRSLWQHFFAEQRRIVVI
ncbi:hypothetical protein TNCV_2896591 [Trichonephila clavipes]|nr:hypothetical protein TNCV_2896591 [Trichonephila clavipes]